MHDPTSPKVAPLTEVLEEAKQAKETVMDAVDELALIHTVLTLELPAEVRQGDAGAAVEQTKDIEERLSDSAELLGQATETLQREIKKKQKTQRRKRKTK